MDDSQHNWARSRFAVKMPTLCFVCAMLPFLGDCAGNPALKAGQPTVQGQSIPLMLADVDQSRAYMYGSGTRAMPKRLRSIW